MEVFVFWDTQDQMSASFIDTLKKASSLFSNKREDRKRVLRSENGLQVVIDAHNSINIVPIVRENSHNSNVNGWMITSKVSSNQRNWYFQVNTQEKNLILNREYQYPRVIYKVLVPAVKQLIDEICKTAKTA